MPFLRYARVPVVAVGHPLAAASARAEDRRRPHDPAPLQPPGNRPVEDRLTEHPWLAGPVGLEPGSAEQRWAAAAGIAAAVVPLESEAAALEGVRAGRGAMLALGHAVQADLRSGALVRVPAAGTPVSGLWWSTVPGNGQATPAARACSGS